MSDKNKRSNRIENQINFDDFEKVHSDDGVRYDVYYNEDTYELVFENHQRIVRSSMWGASYTGDVTHRSADYYNDVVETLLIGEDHIDDWSFFSVKNAGFEFDQDSYKPIRVWASEGFEEFDCDIRLSEVDVIDKNSEETDQFLAFKDGESRN